MNRQYSILVVDQAAESLRMLGNALGADGHAVMEARSGQEALQLLKRRVPDGVLLDACIPGMDGFALCREIRSMSPWSQVPVLFMTDSPDTEQVLKGFASGGVDYVPKPVRLPEVLARLATHLRNAQAIRLAREAVDLAGLGVVVLDAQGQVVWHSPRAERWLTQAFEQDQASSWLVQAWQQGRAVLRLADGRQLQAQYMGDCGQAEPMLLLSLADSANASWLEQVALTPREAEVLSWLNKGKTNRDIADILGMSHRTVSKHLEHIFEKLGVETRTAAAALASQLLKA
nr:response regulator [Comamonas composti]